MKGVSMKRSLLALALSVLAMPAFSMTATVASSTPPVIAPAAQDAAARASSITGTAKAAAPTSATAKAAMPSAAAVVRPSATLSAPGVPMKSNAPAAGKTTGARPASILPPASAQTTIAAPAGSAAWSAVAASNSSMRVGTIEALNVGAGTFQVYGQKLNFDAQRVKVYSRDGKTASAFGLKSGAKVRFTLDPTDSHHRRVAVIYVN